MRKYLLATLISLCLAPAVFAQSESAAGNILFILDGSGSMWGQVEGQHKIAIAKEVMTGLVQELPPNIRAGLEVYGHRSKGDCNDIEIVVPVGSGNRQALIEQIEAITPRGKTPITQAFQQAADQLRAMEDETTVVLVSDGKETCEGDPCTLVRELREQGIKIKVHVVGFDVTHDESEQLVCIAEAGGGTYFSANNAEQLRDALVEVREEVVKMPEPAPQVAEPQPKEPEKIQKTRKTISLAKLGHITVPNLTSREPWVCEQNSDCIGSYSEGYVGNLKPDRNTLEVPPGTYKLKFGNHYVEGIEVQAGKTVEALLGAISIPGLNSREPWVCEQNSDCIGSYSEGYVGNLKPDRNTLEVPPGTYKLKFGNHYVEGIEVQAGKTVEALLGAISIPGLNSREPWVCEQNSDCIGSYSEGYVGNLKPDRNTLEVPPGTYKLKFGNHYVEGIEVGPNEEIVLEM